MGDIDTSDAASLGGQAVKTTERGERSYDGRKDLDLPVYRTA